MDLKPLILKANSTATVLDISAIYSYISLCFDRCSERVLDRYKGVFMSDSRTEDPKVIRPFGASHPVFPTENISRNSYGDISERTTVPGITKREYFAAMAMQGAMIGLGVKAGEFADEEVNPAAVAVDAVKMADALLKELVK